MENHRFLKEKYGLHKAPEVESAAKRTQERTGEKVPQDPSARIQNYLDRLSEILGREKPDKRERGMEAIKHVLHKKFVIKPEEIPEGYFENQRRIAREQGHGDIEVTDEMRKQLSEVIVADQQSSLDKWVDYLASPDATYPDWLKYFAVRSVLDMGEYDKEKKAFTKRSKGTVKPFPDLNREALAYVLDAIEKKQQGKDVQFAALEAEDKEKFEKLLKAENFAKLYAWAIEKVTPASQEKLKSTKGQWVKYDRNSDHMPLVASLQGHGTGWCTAGESTAQAQLKNGDFYVYYSFDQDDKPTVPRAAIRMEDNSIAEVRGIAAEQNLDPYIGEVVQKKLKEFPDGKAYEKKASDMKLLTVVENKVKNGQDLNKDDLVFLYEINAPIEGFGYEKDPRITELRAQRNPEEDMSIIFECDEKQIAHSIAEISEDTKAYVGNLEPGIFDRLPESVKNVYTSFPEGRITTTILEIGGKTPKEYESELAKAGFKIYDYAKQILANVKPSKERYETDIVRLTVADLGFERGATNADIWKRGKELGLDLCPSKVGPELRLSMEDQPMGDYVIVAMEPIADPDGYLGVFSVGRDGDGRWLNASDGRPDGRWDPDRAFAFACRKH